MNYINQKGTYKYINRLITLILSISFVFIMLSTVNTVSADSSIIYVNDSGGNDSWNGEAALWDGSTLLGPKKSISNATGTVTNGGTLNIADGVYSGENNTNITINKNMSIIGQSEESTIIDGADSTQIFVIQKGTIVTIKNITFANGTAGDDENIGYGGAIENYGTLTIENNIFMGNTADFGGAIYNHGNLTVNDSTFSENMAIWNGGAIYNNVGDLDINNTDFVDNAVNGDGVWYSWTRGGAIYNNGTLTVADSYFEDNSAIHFGGAIFNDKDGALEVTDNMFINNTVTLQSGGGTDLNGTSTFFPAGGAIFNAGNLIVSDNLFAQNTANRGAGGAINNINSIIVTDNMFYNNTATWGGAVCNDRGTFAIPTKLSQNFFGNNNAIIGGATYNAGNLIITDDIYINNTSSGIGGVIYNDGNLKVTGSDFEYNNADSGSGGVIYNMGTSNINFSRIVGNTATYGGAIYCDRGQVNATLNWWGSNDDPSINVYGNVTVNPWLVLNITANPKLISNNSNSTITIDLLHDSEGIYHNPSNGHVPDDILVTFDTSLGTIETESFTINGLANSSLISELETGIADVSAIVDDQLVDTFVAIKTDIEPPTVTVIPAGGNYYSPLYVTLNTNEASDIHYTLDSSDPTENSTLYSGPISITTSKVLKFFAIDTAGNQSPIKTEPYLLYAWTPYSYQVTIQYRLSNKKYRIKYRVAYTVKKKVRKKWVLVTKYKWKYKWDYHYGYRTETRWDYRWQLT